MSHPPNSTPQEYLFPAHETLLSTTDTANHVRYVNAAFVRASGFTAEELLGQPNSLVGHPDMAGEVFADMWRSLKAGQTWTSVLKNRRKDGDFYWVRAHAAPMLRQGQLQGYLSVRTQPTHAEIQTADAWHRRFKQGRAGGWAFHRGLIVRTGLMRWASALQLLPTAWRVRLPLLGLGVLLASALLLCGIEGMALGAMAATLAVGLLLCGLWLEAHVTSPLQHLLAAAQKVASGVDCDHPALDRCDNIGLLERSIHQAGLNLRALVTDVNEQMSGVQTASREIATANDELSQRAEQTAANLEQTAAAMEQQTATVQHNSDSAQQASALARGFAVVASEVRNLAGRSAAAAQEIRGLIDASVHQVKGGLQLVTSAGQTMAQMVQQVHRVSDLLAEITTASQEQSLGISQVGQAVAQLDQMTQHNAAMIEQSRMASASMNDKAQRLVEAIKALSA